jgi:haloacetate dehalogenase
MFGNFHTGDVDTSGARIHFRHGGSGPPLLLLHGNPLSHVSWHRMAPRLAETYHVVAADLRGYGDSVGPEDGGENHINYSFRAMAQDQVELMRHLGYEKFFVAGHDRGARTTHRMCLDHPDRVIKAASTSCRATTSGPMRRRAGRCRRGTGCSWRSRPISPSA